MSNYTELLKDPRWQKRRLEILNRDGFTCQFCADDTSTLHVHHFKYSKNPWDALDEDLTTCCEVCHAVIEFFKKTNYPVSKVFKQPLNNGDLIVTAFISKNENYLLAIFKKAINQHLIFYTAYAESDLQLFVRVFSEIKQKAVNV